MEKDYLCDPELVELVPGAADALRRARAAGYRLIGISNQSGIGRGFFDESELDAVMDRLSDLLAHEAASLDAFFYCPHAPDAGCACRKPAAGLLTEAAGYFTWPRTASYVIGDKLSDVALARGAGLSPVLVRTGYGARQEAALTAGEAAAGDVLVRDDLEAAVATILDRRS